MYNEYIFSIKIIKSMGKCRTKSALEMKKEIYYICISIKTNAYKKALQRNVKPAGQIKNEETVVKKYK